MDSDLESFRSKFLIVADCIVILVVISMLALSSQPFSHKHLQSRLSTWFLLKSACWYTNSFLLGAKTTLYWIWMYEHSLSYIPLLSKPHDGDICRDPAVLKVLKLFEILGFVFDINTLLRKLCGILLNETEPNSKRHRCCFSHSIRKAGIRAAAWEAHF